MNTTQENNKRYDIDQELYAIRVDIEKECVSYSQLARLEELKEYIRQDDVVLRECAGIQE